MDGRHHVANLVQPPHAPQLRCWKAGTWWQLVSPASSYHSGGVVNVVLVDGSVQSKADSIDPFVWTAFGTRAGGEVLQ